MNTSKSRYSFQSMTEENFNLKDELEKYLVHWKWFVLCTLASLLLAFLYLKYATPQYLVSSTLLIKEEQSSLSSEVTAFQDLGIFGGGQNNIDNEIQVLKSRRLARSVVEDLKLNVRYFGENKIKKVELYKKETPCILKSLGVSNPFKELDTVLHVSFLSETSFQFSGLDEEDLKTASLGDTLNLGKHLFVLSLNEDFRGPIVDKDVRIVITSDDALIDYLVGRIKIKPVDQLSSVLNLSLKHAKRKKAEDILNTLIDNYNEDVIDDKSEVGKSTSKFIHQRLEIISKELEVVDKTVEEYKKTHKLTNIEQEAAQFVVEVSESEKQLYEMTTQLYLVEFMDNYIKKQGDSFELLPVNLGFQDASISLLTEKYNEVALQRSKILSSSSEENPIIQNLEFQLRNYKKSLKESLINLKASLGISLKEMNKNDKRINEKIVSIPTIEREYRIIQRQQGIKEALYLYLLEKQEEVEISLAVTTSNSKVIDSAYGPSKPVAPKKSVILLASLILGVIIPFGVIYIKDLLDTKLHTRRDLEENVSAPILGDIPINDTKDNIVVVEGGRSSTAEAFRLLRTNLDFMLTDVKTNCKSIFITSTTSGEGKSFVSVNLACTLSLSGKKVALVGMDLRAPKITEYLEVPHKKGVTNYIKDNTLKTEDLKFKLKGYENLDIYSSGIIPPNPAELLLNPRVEEFFKTLNDTYDYLVVDTAPVNLVTDTLMISKYADLFIYVSRANYLDKRLLSIPEGLYKEKRLPNMAMLINGSDYKKSYGYGAYGAYGYGIETSLPWWKTMFRKS